MMPFLMRSARNGQLSPEAHIYAGCSVDTPITPTSKLWTLTVANLSPPSAQSLSPHSTQLQNGVHAMLVLSTEGRRRGRVHYRAHAQQPR